MQQLCNDITRGQYLGFRAGQAAARGFGTSLICLFAREVVMCGQDESACLANGPEVHHVHATRSQQAMFGKRIPL